MRQRLGDVLSEAEGGDAILRDEHLVNGDIPTVDGELRESIQDLPEDEQAEDLQQKRPRSAEEE
ncbi:MAG: hypothetical protein ACLQBX_05970 [Candidatus Limnocylindrales bacterium]